MPERNRAAQLDLEVETGLLSLCRLLARTGVKLGIGEAAAIAAGSVIDDMLDLGDVPEYLIPRARAAGALFRMATPSTGLFERACSEALIDAAAKAGKRG